MPLATRPRRSLLQHLVDLLKYKTLGLWDEEVRVNAGACAEAAPDEEHLGTEVSVLLADEIGTDGREDERDQEQVLDRPKLDEEAGTELVERARSAGEIEFHEAMRYLRRR